VGQTDWLRRRRPAPTEDTQLGWRRDALSVGTPAARP